MELLQEPVEKADVSFDFSAQRQFVSLYDTNDSKSQCRDKKLQLVGCEKSPI